MKPTTNFKLTVGMILLLVCIATAYFVISGLSAKSDKAADYKSRDEFLKSIVE